MNRLEFLTNLDTDLEAIPKTGDKLETVDMSEREAEAQSINNQYGHSYLSGTLNTINASNIFDVGMSVSGIAYTHVTGNFPIIDFAQQMAASRPDPVEELREQQRRDREAMDAMNAELNNLRTTLAIMQSSPEPKNEPTGFFSEQ